MNWATATSWVAGLNINGITGWRLPTMVDSGTPGCNNAFSGTDCGYNVQTTSGATVYSEMASMFYNTLGNKAYYSTSGVGPQPGSGLTNIGPFSNIRPYYYWSATEYAPLTSYAWDFNFDDGHQRADNKFDPYVLFAWAVHSGDIGAAIVPIPAAVWLFGSGLLGLMGIARRRSAK